MNHTDTTHNENQTAENSMYGIGMDNSYSRHLQWFSSAAVPYKWNTISLLSDSYASC